MPEKKRRAYSDRNEKWLRDGPKPLSVHMNMVMAEKASGAVSDQDVNRFLQGVRKYQTHPFQRHVPRYETLWTGKGAALRFIPATCGHGNGDRKRPRTGLFIVPSLINNTDIFDLLPEKSFVQWMAGKGMDIYILDWGTIEKVNPECSMADLFNGCIFPALQTARSHLKTGDPQGRLFGLGYCMGGTLLTAALCDKRGAELDGAVFLASPWDFAAGDKALANRVRALKVSAAHMLTQKERALPVDMVQTVFASLMPSQTIRKFSQFCDMDDGSTAEKVFVATEDWLNNGRDIPHGIARSIVFDWYDRNETAHNLWRPYGHRISPDDIETPVLLLASKRDRLVPYDSTALLAKKIGNCRIYDPGCGHIGFMAGRNAEQKVWEIVHEWLCRETAPS